MTIHYALIDSSTNIVTNVIWWDGVQPYVPPVGFFVEQTDVGSIGWSYNPIAKTFTPPPAPTPAPAPLAPVIAASYAASLRRQADALQKQGKTAQATALYLKAAGVQT